MSAVGASLLALPINDTTTTKQTAAYTISDNGNTNLLSSRSDKSSIGGNEEHINSSSVYVCARKGQTNVN